MVLASGCDAVGCERQLLRFAKGFRRQDYGLRDQKYSFFALQEHVGRASSVCSSGVHVYLYMYLHVHTYVHLYKYMYVYIYIYIYVCMYVK